MDTSSTAGVSQWQTTNQSNVRGLFILDRVLAQLQTNPQPDCQTEALQTVLQFRSEVESALGIEDGN